MSTILFQRSKTYSQLVKLCSGVVSSLNAKALVLELFHFLIIKRNLAHSISEVVKVLPGPLVDKLWHRMLMESEVSGIFTVIVILQSCMFVMV